MLAQAERPDDISTARHLVLSQRQKDNQYHCEKCDKKVDALKGLRFESLPYILTMQLKRFDFDYQTFRRIKLNSRCVRLTLSVCDAGT